MARIRTTQANLRGPVVRDENLIAHSWFVTLVYGAVIGAIALLVWMFQAGAWSERRWPIQAPAPVVIQQQTPPPPVVYTQPPLAVHAPVPSAPAVVPDELSPEELDRRHTEYLHRRGQ